MGRLRDQWWCDLKWWASGEFGVGLWDAVFGRRLQRWHESGHVRALQHPRYREIELLIGTEDRFLENDEAWDLFDEQAAIFHRVSPPPWYLRARWWWQGHAWPFLARMRRA